MQGADDAKNRSLPTNLFAKLLGSKMGKDVDPRNIHGMLAEKFGDDATKKVFSALGMVKAQADKMAATNKHAGMVSKLLGMCLSSSGPQGQVCNSAPSSSLLDPAAGHACRCISTHFEVSFPCTWKCRECASFASSMA